MTIILRHCDSPHLGLIEFSGPVALRDVQALLRHRAQRRALLTADTFYHVRPDCTIGDVTVESIALLRARGREQMKQAPLPLIRRAAWLCESPQALAVLTPFMSGRTPDDGFFVAPRLVGSMAEAADWLMLPEAVLTALAAGAPITAAFPAPLTLGPG